jgi:hypothetical protein
MSFIESNDPTIHLALNKIFSYMRFNISVQHHKLLLICKTHRILSDFKYSLNSVSLYKTQWFSVPYNNIALGLLVSILKKEFF